MIRWYLEQCKFWFIYFKIASQLTYFEDMVTLQEIFIHFSITEVITLQSRGKQHAQQDNRLCPMAIRVYRLASFLLWEARIRNSLLFYPGAAVHRVDHRPVSYTIHGSTG